MTKLSTPTNLLPAGTVIMLHGLGDSGDGWAPVGAEWAPELRHVKFIFPHAPNVSCVSSSSKHGLQSHHAVKTGGCRTFGLVQCQAEAACIT
jgi:predicted esterase